MLHAVTLFKKLHPSHCGGSKVYVCVFGGVLSGFSRSKNVGFILLETSDTVSLSCQTYSPWWLITPLSISTLSLINLSHYAIFLARKLHNSSFVSPFELDSTISKLMKQDHQIQYLKSRGQKSKVLTTHKVWNSNLGSQRKNNLIYHWQTYGWSTFLVSYAIINTCKS